MSRFVLQIANIRESLVMALNAIRTSKLRSALTLLGVVVGVFSIISVMTAVGVLKNSIEEGMTQLGANTFQIQKFPAFNTGPHDHARFRNRKNITYEQAVQVYEKATFAAAVGHRVVARSAGSSSGRGSGRTRTSRSPARTSRGWSRTTGSRPTAGSFRRRTWRHPGPVAVIGTMVAEKLFPESINPIGEHIRVDGTMYQVIGVFAKKGGALGGNQDNFVAIPITTFFQKYGKNFGQGVHIMVKAKSREVFDDAMEQSVAILRTARNVPPGAEDDFAYFSNDSLIKQFNEFTLYLRLGVLVVSSIALLAAGVGIMNIMLVSVTERTREIGIRKAIGAQKRDILSQFMIEAIILCEIGGFIGIVLGMLGGNVVGLLLDVPAVIPWDWVAIGVAVCSFVGLVFGVYPAWKAASLDPIESLRYE